MNFHILGRKCQYNCTTQPKILHFRYLSKKQEGRNHDDEVWPKFLSCIFSSVKFVKDLPGAKVLWTFIFWAENANTIVLRSLKSCVFEICQKSRKSGIMTTIFDPIFWAVFFSIGNELGPSLGSKFYEHSYFEPKMAINNYYVA